VQACGAMTASAAMKAALFDVDGVLIDSYDAHFRSWRTLAEEEGLPFTESDFARTFGRTSREVIGELWPHRAGDVEALDARKESCYRDLIRDDFPAMEGAAELVRALDDAGWRLAVASSGPPDNVELVLDRLGVADRFDAVVTGRDVQRGKPDPQVFVTAAERIGAPPGRCVVLEDAPVGLAAAAAGGMRCVALLSTGRRREDFLARAPDLFVESLREVDPERLATLLG
jgi:beta-phosphoglucomutase